LYALMGPERFKKYTSYGKQYIEARDRLLNTVGKLIENRLKQNDGVQHRDLLQYCIESANENPGEEKYSADELTSEIMLFFFAGHDSTANMIAWSLYHIAKNPEIKTKLLEEIKEAGPPMDGTVPSWSVVNNLPYMTQVLKESLRLYPIVPFASRQLIKDEQYKDRTLPAGTLFFLMGYSVQRDLRHYHCQDVTEFNPDHFSPENTKNRHPFAWIPFSAGLRNCIGMQFAFVEARTVLAYILPRFDFTVSSEAQLFEKILLTSRNMKLRVKTTPGN